jgi:hypothetical protein
MSTGIPLDNRDGPPARAVERAGFAMRRRARWLAAVFSVSSACGAGTPAEPVSATWAGATALSAAEDDPSGVVVAGTSVIYTTGRTVAGENAVRIAPLEPASPVASRILVANPGGEGPNGALAVDGDDLYVAAGLGVVRVSIATGAVTPIVSGRPSGVTAVAVDNRFVWWTTSTYQAPLRAEVARMPKRGGAVEILASGADDTGNVYNDEPARKAVAVRRAAFYSMVLDGDAALVANPNGLLRVANGRAPQVVLGEGKLFGGALGPIAGDANHIYGEIAGGQNQLFAVPRTGGEPVELARNVDNVSNIIVADGEVIFMTPGGSGGKKKINAVPTAGGAVRAVTSGRYARGDLAVAGNRLVFSAGSRVWSVPLRTA